MLVSLILMLLFIFAVKFKLALDHQIMLRNTAKVLFEQMAVNPALRAQLLGSVKHDQH